MILYQHVSLVRTSSISLLPTDSRSVESSRNQLLAIKAIIRQIGLQGGAQRKIAIGWDANHNLDPQGTQVCSSCLIELGVVCARLVSRLHNPKRSDAVRGAHSDRGSFKQVNSSEGRANVECGGFWGNG
jgi:hypothetical protein